MTHGGDEPAELMERLVREPNVYVSAGRLPRAAPAPEGPRSLVAAEVHALVCRLHEEHWHRYGSDPVPVGQVEASLVPWDASDATVLMRELASVSLLWPSHAYRDRDEADAVARGVVAALGSGACWWSNRDDGSVSGVTGAAMDTLVTGSDGDRFVVLIQVEDD
ncbi:hypothetical protein ACFZAG_08250 [Streptomyces sp. NPDC012403]|uniref:hypothetical protein n=1 Tax=Streptomyces sp. NPDC012403 TaxID=3364831 RepID=UPI0036E2484E